MNMDKRLEVYLEPQLQPWVCLQLEFMCSQCLVLVLLLIMQVVLLKCHKKMNLLEVLQID